MTLLDGKATAATMRAQLKERVSQFFNKYQRSIGLAVVLVGENPASQVYVRNKIKACEEIGVQSYPHYLPAHTSQEQALALIRQLAQDNLIDGILLQLPLPSHLDSDALLQAIPLEKDVDGFSCENLGRLAMNEDAVVACTPFGVLKLLEHYQIELQGKKAVVVGRSNVVGKPMALLLLNANATVTVCHSLTNNLAEECRSADILIAAVGKANFITEDMVKEGAVVVDVGMNRDKNGKLCGDVDFERVKEKASMITPVPGGVGPMTITMLLYNVCKLAERRMEKQGERI